MTLKERVKGSVKFKYFRDNALWYTTDDGWVFPVPISDTGNDQGGAATFLAVDRGVVYMRWIRKQMETEAALKGTAGEV